jgi:hypothetical protein
MMGESYLYLILKLWESIQAPVSFSPQKPLERRRLLRVQ